MNAHFESAERFKNEGRFDEAIEELRLVLRLDPGCTEAILKLAHLFYLSRQFPESISSFIHAEARGVKLDADDLFILGEAYATKSFHRKAILSYGRSLALADRADTHFARGNSFQTLQDRDRAAQAYEDALRLQPNHVGAHYSLAGVHAEEGDLRKALEEYEEWVKLMPEYSSTHHSAAIAELRNGDPKRALELVRAMLNENPNEPESQFLQGFAYAEMSDTEQAITALENCLKLSTHHPLALSLLTHLR